MLDLTLFFMGRFARQRSVKLSARKADEGLSLYTCPLRLMLALCACVDFHLARTAEGGLIDLQGEGDGEQVFFHVRIQQGPDAAPVSGASGEEGAVIDPVLRALHGRLAPLRSEEAGGVDLILPVGGPES